ncbi:hypothetical protein [Arthrobacter zhaoguopingii]|uniref:hypothetical protein n=1 Tax=Arthrobacter zhaoguopingii TaxID=2681491 RepID=UPI001359DCA9|nr:hypothetical protein [Arthrobacter zhaoguopingii]
MTTEVNRQENIMGPDDESGNAAQKLGGRGKEAAAQNRMQFPGAVVAGASFKQLKRSRPLPGGTGRRTLPFTATAHPWSL